MTLAWGEIAYEAYRENSRDVAALSGTYMPEWEDVKR